MNFKHYDLATLKEFKQNHETPSAEGIACPRMSRKAKNDLDREIYDRERLEELADERKVDAIRRNIGVLRLSSDEDSLDEISQQFDTEFDLSGLACVVNQSSDSVSSHFAYNSLIFSLSKNSLIQFLGRAH